MELAFVIAIGELAIKHGVPAVIQILNEWQVEEPTLEDIEELKARVPHPDNYLPDKDPA